MSNEILAPSKATLLSIYEKDGETISSLARRFNTSNPTIRKWLIKYNIPRKSHKQASTEANNRKRFNPPSKEILEEQYQEKSIKQLENHYNVGQESIYMWLNYHNIPIKSLSNAVFQAKERTRTELIPPYEELVHVYNEKQNYEETANHFGISISFLRNVVFKHYNMKAFKLWRSGAEKELFDFVSIHDVDHDWEHSNRKLIYPFELDMVCHERKLAIEYCGLYWHSEISGNKEKNYHRNKMLKCHENGYDLITVFEYDDMTKVKRFILHKLGLSKKVYARNLTIKEISPQKAKKFHDDFHMHGSIGAKHHYALVNTSDEPFCVVSFGLNRFDGASSVEIRRATIGDTAVIGGISKLIKHYINTHKPEKLSTFADLRFGNGNVYEKCGMIRMENDSNPNYWYFNKKGEVYSRVAFQKHKLKNKLKIFDHDLTEFENMKANNWDRIWDCGNSKYQLS